MPKPFMVGIPRRVEAAFRSTRELYRAVGHNCGNLAFVHAIDAHLGGNIPRSDWDQVSTLINDGGELAVFAAANQLGRHYDATGAARYFDKISVPIVVIGLGAQIGIRSRNPRIPKSTIRWVRWLADRGPRGKPNIGVRGPFTLEVLRKFGLDGHATIIGCPSLFINPEPALGSQIIRRLRPPGRVAVVAGHQHWRHLHRLEASLGRMVAQTNGCYIGQGAYDMMELTRGRANQMDEASLRQCRDYVCPNMELQDFVDWSTKYSSIFFDIDNWIEHLKRFDFVIGTRIHGTVLGLQAGVPSMCIVHDIRTLELCQTLMVPHVLADDVRDGIGQDELLSYFKFDPHEFDRNRRMLCRAYLDFLKYNQLTPAKWVEAIAGRVDAPADVCSRAVSAS